MTKRGQIFMPLTQSQSAIWAGYKLHIGCPLYNMVHTFELDGPIHTANFVNAFQELVNRAEVLRTVFREIQANPHQYVLPTLKYELDVVDFRTGSDYSLIDAWIEKRARLNFDVSKPLFDAALLQLPEGKSMFYLNIHHLLTDATSSTILLKGISSLYRHIQQGTIERMDDFPPFSRYILEEHEQRNNIGNKSLREYWKKKVATLPSSPRLYGKTNSDGNTNSWRTSIRLGTDLSQRIKNLVNQKDVRSFTPQLSLYSFFASLLSAYVYRISGQERFAIGTPVHNRHSQQHRNTPGLFIEFFALIAEVSAGDQFKNLLERTRLETNALIKYAQRGTSSPELYRSYNVILNFITASFDDFNGRQVTSRWIHPGHSDPTHELRCHVVDFDSIGEIEIIFDLNETVFGPELREQAPQHFINLLKAVVEDVEIPIEACSIITNREREQFLASPKDSAPIETIMDCFHTIVEAFPENIALRYGNATCSYRELNIKANQLADTLEAKGITQGTVIGVYFYRSPEYIVSLLAIMKLDATFVPIAADQPQTRAQHILSDAKCQLVLTDQEHYSVIEEMGIPGHVVRFEGVFNPDQARSAARTKGKLYSTAYIMYTSGSTGTPKGVMVSQQNLSNYVLWAKNEYSAGPGSKFPLFTSIGFDLTITSTFLPLISGGELVIYRENLQSKDLSIFKVVSDNLVNTIKLTPSHLQLLDNELLTDSKIRTLIVGGEALPTSLAGRICRTFGNSLRLFNEYGPTEATVGCIAHEFSSSGDTDREVPIGRPIGNMRAYILDSYGNLLPKGVIGQLYVSGAGIAQGYMGRYKETKEKFLPDPYHPGNTMYDTGDLARWNAGNILEYHGRLDEQVKIGGYRIELQEIEANLNRHAGITSSAVVISCSKNPSIQEELEYCITCGLPSNYPQTDFDEHGVCNLCQAFESYKDKASLYFKTEADLERLLKSQASKDNYDCLALLSGGKDSSYVLARLVGMGLRVLAFTLDNGYISHQAKNNIDRIVKTLGVEHMYGSTPYMNKIFVDSLQRHHNVCNGCFKAIYTLSTQVALEKKIPFIVTGLSRGQFFETRLSEELFWETATSTRNIDETILQARKIYHREEDAVKKHLDVSIFEDDSTFDKVQFVDFFRYCDVSLSEMLGYLKKTLGWVRPTNTGRSTNCLINQAGIYVHKSKNGYSNYAFPYSWDVRLGHKTRSETLDEINEPIDVDEVSRILKDIGYTEIIEEATHPHKLVAFYTGVSVLSQQEAREYLSQYLPTYMIPYRFQFITELPLTANGKTDKNALLQLVDNTAILDVPHEAPRNEIEELLEEIWREVLKLDRPVGIHENFISLGGHSLAAIRLTARANDLLELTLPLSKVFELPSIAQYAKYIEDTLIELME